MYSCLHICSLAVWSKSVIVNRRKRQLKKRQSDKNEKDQGSKNLHKQRKHTGAGHCDSIATINLSCRLLHLANEGRFTLSRQRPPGGGENTDAYTIMRTACYGDPRLPPISSFTSDVCPEGSGLIRGPRCLNYMMIAYIRDVHRKLGRIQVNAINQPCFSTRTFPNRYMYLVNVVDLQNLSGNRSDALTMVNLCNAIDGQGTVKADHVVYKM